MSISVTKNYEQNTFNPIKWGLYGAGLGVIARSLIPVTNQEDTIFSEVMAKRKSVVRDKVSAELAEIKKNMQNASIDEKPAYDMYLRYSDPNLDKALRPSIEEEASRLPEIARRKFNELKKHIDAKVAEAKYIHNFISRAVIKEGRSLFNFVSIGALLSVGIAFVSYVLSKMSSEAKS